jgi:hypothetical protein
MERDTDHLDGNAAAGLLEEIFAFEVTTARAVCAACTQEVTFGEMAVYALELGAIMRCPGCGEVMVRISKLDGERWIDAAGMRMLRVQIAG